MTLTTYDPDHPYYLAEYDLPTAGSRQAGTTFRGHAGLRTLIVVAGVAFGLAACQPSSDCGRVLTRDTTLRADVLNCPGDGLVIGADGIELRLAGHTVDGAEGSGSAGSGRRATTGSSCPVLAGSRGSRTGSAAGGRGTGSGTWRSPTTGSASTSSTPTADGSGNHPFSNEGGMSGPNRGVLLEDL